MYAGQRQVAGSEMDTLAFSAATDAASHAAAVSLRTTAARAMCSSLGAGRL